MKESASFQEKFTRLQAYIESVRKSRECTDDPSSLEQPIEISPDKKGERNLENKETRSGTFKYVNMRWYSAVNLIHSLI